MTPSIVYVQQNLNELQFFSAGPIGISTGFPFFGTTKTTVYVNVNGALTFNGNLSIFTPVCTASRGGYGLVMPYWYVFAVKLGKKYRKVY